MLFDSALLHDPSLGVWLLHDATDVPRGCQVRAVLGLVQGRQCGRLSWVLGTPQEPRPAALFLFGGLALVFVVVLGPVRCVVGGRSGRVGSPGVGVGTADHIGGL